jgi:hypothetical protein
VKCIYCFHKTSYKNRGSGRCEKCGREFAFEPKHDPKKITDQRFKKTFEEVSANDTYYFSAAQFRYALDRRLRHNRWSNAWLSAAGIGLVVLFGSGFLLRLFGPHLSLLAIAVAVVGSFIVSRLQPVYSTSILNQYDMDRYISKWESVHGPIPYLLPDLQSTGSISVTEKEPDLTDYTFSRVLVVDSAETANILIVNSFHIINNCPVLSVDGYPPGTFNTLLGMLQRDPENLEVYALHDASVAGCMLPLTLPTKEWFPDPATHITDLGLRPRHIGVMRLPGGTSRVKLLLRNLVQWRGGRLVNAVVLTGSYEVIPEQLRSILDAQEVAWMEQGNRVELAFMPPQRLMNSIRHAFRRKDAGLATEIADSFWFPIEVDDEPEIDFDSDFG